MTPTNLLILMSDQHNRQVLGCYGHPVVRTPNLDRLAARGTRFTAASTPSPICVPARASFATGRWCHQTGHWDNAHPYHGDVPSWAHRLTAQGTPAVSIGKLHYRDSSDPNGFAEEIMPLHVLDGVGDLYGLIRGDDLPLRKKNRGYVADAKGGESPYTEYDRKITAAARRWLREEAPRHRDRPWVLFVSLVCPHPPFTAPEAYYRLYPQADLPWPVQCGPEHVPLHPSIEDYRHSLNFTGFYDPATIRKALAAYFGLVSFVDDNVGQVLGALEEAGLAGSTRVLYTSDHGESLGRRGIWGKSTLYEESAAIPMLLAGPGVPAGAACTTPVSLVDGFPTVLDCVGARPDPADRPVGHSLLGIARGETPARTVLSEYHAMASRAGSYMIRHGDHKYIRHVGYPPQLFDLARDPDELHDLAPEPASRPLLWTCEAALRTLLDPEAVDARCKADQRAMIERHGGKAKVLARGTFGNTPAPGERPSFVS
ncbi:MAG: sulfatase-like hydrolase/transferase [Candidatus Lambdaproteobacteria bacterium]|nr:sulfatase-like hydrolase/transferase [Candidatus Lambdaproteobacteria bacterium]